MKTTFVSDEKEHMVMRRLITPRLLKRYSPCSMANFLFDLYPDGTEVTIALCVKHAKQIDWDWASRHLLSKQKQRDFAAAYTEIRKQYDMMRNNASGLFESLLVEKEAMEKAKKDFDTAKADYDNTWKLTCENAEIVFHDTIAKAVEEYQKNIDKKNESFLAYIQAVARATENLYLIKDAAEKARTEVLKSFADASDLAERKFFDLRYKLDTKLFSEFFNTLQATEFAIAWQTETDQRFIEILDAKNQPRIKKKKIEEAVS